MGDTAPSEIGADPAQGQSASQEDLLSARTQVTPWMETIAQRIDEAITYPRDVFGEPPLFELDLTFFVRPDGSLSHFDNVGPENRKTAWLVRSITRALANFPLEKKIQRPLGLTRMRARFVLEFPEFRARGPAKLRSWIGSRMIFKESRKKSLSLIHPMAMRLAHSDMFALGVGTDLIALYKYLFPDRLPSTDYKRLQDDIFFRLREMEFSCDTGRAEGACLEAGRIHRMLGQRSEASIWLRKACQMSLQEACDELRILRNGV